MRLLSWSCATLELFECGEAVVCALICLLCGICDSLPPVPLLHAVTAGPVVAVELGSGAPKRTLADGRLDMRELRRLVDVVACMGDVAGGMSRPRPAPSPPMISMLSRLWRRWECGRDG